MTRNPIYMKTHVFYKRTHTLNFNPRYIKWLVNISRGQNTFGIDLKTRRTTSHRSPFYSRVRRQNGVAGSVAGVYQQFLVFTLVQTQTIARANRHLVNVYYVSQISVSGEQFSIYGHHLTVQCQNVV